MMEFSLLKIQEELFANIKEAQTPKEELTIKQFKKFMKLNHGMT